ncbi:hypothetical protein Zm00014a_011987 [Zea mays]|uniref:Uncharacterized protein n=2 Tax=Zea mays TaxID=4577 RepID=A0A317Y924_MAIZE|nr:hypothetical protein Zm00014a_011987 [Zea mays]PWZ54302.1 hypothetical protein Zm00014a_011987 [Zea mays]
MDRCTKYITFCYAPRNPNITPLATASFGDMADSSICEYLLPMSMTRESYNPCEGSISAPRNQQGSIGRRNSGCQDLSDKQVWFFLCFLVPGHLLDGIPNSSCTPRSKKLGSEHRVCYLRAPFRIVDVLEVRDLRASFHVSPKCCRSYIHGILLQIACTIHRLFFSRSWSWKC